MMLKLTESNTPVQMILASGSKFFLEGMRKILQDEGRIKIMAEALNCKETEKYVAQIRPKFLFVDNRSLNLNVPKLMNLIGEKSPDTRVILLGDQTKDELSFLDIIYVTGRINSSELIRIISNPSD